MASSPEAMLISSIIRDQNFQISMKASITAEMFHGYQDEYRWLEAYYSRHRKNPSRIAFKQAFPEFRIREVNDTGHFADEVRKSHARHQLTEAMRDVADHIADGDIDTAIHKMSGSVITIAAGMGINDDGDIFRAFRDITDDIEARRQRYEKYGASGILTGFDTLDERTGGPQPGELWVVAARQGVGKSWQLQRMAASAAMNGKIVQFNALEQSRSQVAMRIYSMLSGQMGQELFRSTELIQGRDYDPKSFRKFVSGLQTDVKGKLHVNGPVTNRLSALDIAAQIERNKPDIVFIDYLGLMRKSSADHLGMSQLSNDVNQIALEYNVPIVAAAQLNREAAQQKKGEPANVETLAESDEIGRVASMVITSAQWSPSVLKSKAVKVRNGRSDWVWFTHFDPDHGHFKEITHDEAERIKEQDADAADAQWAVEKAAKKASSAPQAAQQGVSGTSTQRRPKRASEGNVARLRRIK